ncbi:MAG: PEX11 family protein [archaeon]|nr:PEX11 family protein [archaeon]
MRGALKEKSEDMSNRFSKLSLTAKQARICYNLFHIPRDIDRLRTLQAAFKTDKLVPLSRATNLLNQGAAASSLMMMIFQQFHLYNARGITTKNNAKYYNRLYSYCWCSLIFFNILSKKVYLDNYKETKDKKKDERNKRLERLNLLGSSLDLFPAIGGTGLVAFSDLAKGFGGTTSAFIAIYTNHMKQIQV